jgi:hypothetical protein
MIMVEKFGKGISTRPPHDPSAWLKIVASDGSHRNHVYGLPITMTR